MPAPPSAHTDDADVKLPPWHIVRWVLSLSAGILFAGGISLATWLAFSAPGGPDEIAITIPAGTAERVAAGAPPPSIPDRLTFAPGDTLVLRNNDGVEHRIGSYNVPAGETLSVPLQTQAGSDRFACTFHPAGAIGLDVRSPGSPLSMLLPALLLGTPLGIVIGAVWTILARLDTGGPSPQGGAKPYAAFRTLPD